MALAARSARLLAACCGAVALSQLPAFADHYRQNLAGQIVQARYSLEEVSRRAEQEGMTLPAYLEAALADSGAYSAASVRDSQRTLHRLDRLERSQRALEAATPFTQPLAMLEQLDRITLQATARYFEPNLPLGLAGAIYAVSGALLALFLSILPQRLTKRSAIRKTAAPDTR